MKSEDRVWQLLLERLTALERQLGRQGQQMVQQGKQMMAIAEQQTQQGKQMVAIAEQQTSNTAVLVAMAESVDERDRKQKARGRNIHRALQTLKAQNKKLGGDHRSARFRASRERLLELTGAPRQGEENVATRKGEDQ